jgi:uncharacterized membrane protein
MDGTLPPPRIEHRATPMRLTSGWSRTIFLGWSGLTAALASVGISSHIIGRPVFWLDDQRWAPPVLALVAILVTGPMLVTAVWSYTGRAWIPAVSGASTLVLVASAFVDRHSSPGAAVVTGALAIAAALLSAAAFLVRSHSVA